MVIDHEPTLILASFGASTAHSSVIFVQKN